MHPILSDFPSNAFYEGTLENGVTSGDRKINSKYLLLPKIKYFFI